MAKRDCVHDEEQRPTIESWGTPHTKVCDEESEKYPRKEQWLKWSGQAGGSGDGGVDGDGEFGIFYA